MNDLPKIIVFAILVILSVIFCFVTFLFLKAQNFYIDFQAQYRAKGVSCEEPIVKKKKKKINCCPSTSTCQPATNKAPCKEPKSKTCMKVPPNCFETESDSCIIDSCNKYLNKKKCTSPSFETINEKCNQKKQCPSKELKCCSKTKTVSLSPKPCRNLSPNPCKEKKKRSKSKNQSYCKDSSDACSYSESERHCKPMERHRKKYVNCDREYGEKMVPPSSSLSTSSSEMIENLLKETKDSRPSALALANDSCSQYQQTKMKILRGDDPMDNLVFQKSEMRQHNISPCSNQNLDKLREKRKERKKTLMKLQYESGKLDDIHKWISGASNSDRSC